jgi:hypothetical protein
MTIKQKVNKIPPANGKLSKVKPVRSSPPVRGARKGLIWVAHRMIYAVTIGINNNLLAVRNFIYLHGSRYAYVLLKIVAAPAIRAVQQTTI